MLIRDKMTKNVITINVSDTLAKAEKLMQGYNIHHLPVLSGNKLSGLLSASNIERFKQDHNEEITQNTTVKDVLPPNQRVTTIMPDVSIEQAVMLLQNNKIGSLPVLEDGKIIGIITLTDVLNTFIDLLWTKKSRITVELGPEPGLIADIASVIGSFNVSILRIVMFPRPDQANCETLISLDTDDVKPIIEKLQQKGYEIRDYS